ncbi:MAG: 5-oxoprolinase subunit PxpB [Sneathiella sp.]
MLMDARVLMMGDAAFTIEFPNLKGVEGARRVRALQRIVQAEISVGALDGIIDLISATRSLSVCLEPAYPNFEDVRDHVLNLAQIPYEAVAAGRQTWTLPVCYQGEFAPDLNDVSEKSGLSLDEVIKLHSSQIYDVLLIGFLPGFPFMSEVPEALRFARRTNPRLRVPAGSVAIANEQSAIYPWESPGGWHLLGRCPVPLFDPLWDRPSLLSPGEQVSFDPISKHDFKLIQNDLASGRMLLTFFQDKGQ